MTTLGSALHLGLMAFVAVVVCGSTVASPIVAPDKIHREELEPIVSPSSALLSKSVLRRSDRRKRSGYDETNERGVDVFPLSAMLAQEDRKRNLEQELFDGDDRENAEKRGRWAKNNVQMWGKRSSSNGAMNWPNAAVDGLWSKRKKTWEKNNFKMWGKRSDSGAWNDRDATALDQDEDFSDELRRRLIEAAASAHQTPSWAVRAHHPEEETQGPSRHDRGEEIKRELSANVNRLHRVQLERPSTMDDDESDEFESNVALPIAAASAYRHRLPWYKRGAWATNNMRIWG